MSDSPERVADAAPGTDILTRTVTGSGSGSGDAATMAGFYADDAEVMAPDSQPVRGREDVEAFFKAAAEGARRSGMRRTIQVRRVERSGDLGYVLSTVVLELPAAGDQATTTFNDVTVWRLEHGEGWRIVVDSANRTAPPSPAPTRL